MPRLAYLSLCLAGIAVSAFTIGPGNWAYVQRGQTDFMDLYAGGKLAFSHDLYDPGQVTRVEAETGGRYSPTRLFMRPAAFAVLLWPFSQMPYRTASWAWEATNVVVLIGFIALWPPGNRWLAAVVCCWSVPAFMSLAEGQDIAFLLASIALALWLLRAGRDFAAGIVLSLCASKFHLFLLVPVWLIAGRRWKIARGLAAGGAGLAVLSFANGLDWPVRYVRLLLNPVNNPYASVMPGIHGLVDGLPGHLWIEGLAFAVIGVLVWRASRRGSVEWGLAAALTGGILVAPHAYVADCALLIPAGLIALDRSSGSVLQGRLAIAVLTPPIYWLFLSGEKMPLTCLPTVFLLSLGAGNQAGAPVVSEVIVSPLEQDQHPVFELHNVEQMYK